MFQILIRMNQVISMRVNQRVQNTSQHMTHPCVGEDPFLQKLPDVGVVSAKDKPNARRLHELPKDLDV